LADEPTSNLDVETAKEVIEILKSLSKSKLVIMVSHEDSQVINDADVIFKLNQHDEIIIEKRKISKPTNIFYDEIKHKNSFKNDFSITIKMLKNVLINKKAKHLSSIILLSLILFFTTIITIVIFSNYQYMYYTYAVEENNIYELVDINSNDLTYDRMALLENKFDDVYYYLRVFENITNTTTVTRLYINNDLQGYQTIISLNIADQLVLSQYQGALKRSDLYNTYISIFDVNLQIVNIDDQLISYQEDIYENQYIFISLDFYNQIISEIEIIYDLQINNEMFYDFEINASNELINNEIILPNEFVNINETASDITIILKNFNMNDQIDFQIKDINDLMHKEIWVSDEMYQYFVYQNVDGGIIKASLDWDSFNKLNNESIFINSSYLNYYISLENLIFNYQVLIIFIYMIFVILDLLIINSIYEQDIKENHSDFASLHLLGRSNIGKNRVLLYVLLMDGLSLLVNVSMFLIFSKQLDTLFRSYVFPIIMYHYVAFNLLVWCCGFIVSIMYVFLKIIKYQNIDMSKVY
ncbi:MAG: hypothetical protein WCR19_03455, partial [Acholeplasmataceae bacterium]